MTESSDDTVLDVFTPVPDPFSALEDAHRRCPVTPTLQDAVVVTGRENVHAVLADAETFRNQIRPKPEGAEPSLVHVDGEDHARLRRLVVRAFTPKAVKRLEDPTREMAHRLVDAFVTRGNADLCAEFSFLLPAMVIAELVGVPDGDRSQFLAWAEDAISSSVPGAEVSGPTAAELRGYVAQIVEQRRVDPGDDLLSDLIEVNEGGERLSTAELCALVRQLILAGSDTTSNLLGAMLHFLLASPEHWERLKENPDEFLPNVIEETLRMEPPLYWVPRMTAEDTQVAGVDVHAGTMVCVALAHANRDPEVTDSPNVWDMDRPAAKNKRHYTFGFGEHYCVGSALARLEAKVALEVLMERVPDIKLIDGFEFAPHGPLMMRGAATLPVEFEARRGSRA